MGAQRYEFIRREVWTRTVVVEAASVEEARIKGDICLGDTEEDNFEYSHTLGDDEARLIGQAKP